MKLFGYEPEKNSISSITASESNYPVLIVMTQAQIRRQKQSVDAPEQSLSAQDEVSDADSVRKKNHVDERGVSIKAEDDFSAKKAKASSARNIKQKVKNDDVIFRKSNGYEFILEKGEFDELIRICGIRKIQSKKVRIYTPELFLLEYGESYQRALLKLGEYVLALEDGKLREITVLDMASNGFGKFIQYENLIWGIS
ncbi:MAG: hypothetical protein Q4D65_04385 [Peptostreptococcaceae bacterium]|nr:hypothetical protein [Peptostreptococcaceae bacterium]